MSKIKRIIEVDEKLVCEGFERTFTEEERDILIRAIGNSKPYDDSGDLISREWLREEFKKSKKITFAEIVKIACIVDSAPTVSDRYDEGYADGYFDGSVSADMRGDKE